MLEVAGLRAGYGRTEVLRGVDLSLARGEIVALLGANGAGKTTFIAALSGLIAPTAGTIRFDGRDLTGAGPRAAIDAGIVQAPEGRHIFPDMTVRENLLLGGFRRGRARRAANMARALDAFPRLRERLSQDAATMSGGEQQMLAIGRAMMSEPEVLILDEPSLGLSPLLVEEMFGLIGALNREGLTILLVEQNVRLSLGIATRGFVMENGAIAVSGPARDLLDSPELQKAYLGV